MGQEPQIGLLPGFSEPLLSAGDVPHIAAKDGTSKIEASRSPISDWTRIVCGALVDR